MIIMRTFKPSGRTRFRWIYLNALMLTLVLGSAVSTLGGRGSAFASLASLLILAASAAAIAYESRRWRALQIHEAVRTDLERLSMATLSGREAYNLVDALSGGARSKAFHEDLHRRLIAVWASPLFVHGVAVLAIRETLWPYACAIGLICLAYTVAFLPKAAPIKDGVIRSAFEGMRHGLDTAGNGYRGKHRQAG